MTIFSTRKVDRKILVSGDIYVRATKYRDLFSSRPGLHEEFTALSYGHLECDNNLWIHEALYPYFCDTLGIDNKEISPHDLSSFPGLLMNLTTVESAIAAFEDKLLKGEYGGLLQIMKKYLIEQLIRCSRVQNVLC